MDGTLLNEEGRVSTEFFKIFHKLMEKEIKFVVASGRQYHQLFSSFNDVADKIIYIAENGTLVKEDGKEIYSCLLSREEVREIIECGNTIEGIYLVVCGKNCAYIDTNDERAVKEIAKYYYNYKIVRDLRQVEDEFLKVAVLDFNGSEKNSNKVFLPKFNDRLQVTVSADIWLDIYNKQANKGRAIKLLQEKFEIKKEETMAFGDYYNDIEMLTMAHYSYAMENAPDGVKEHANFVAKSNIENGVIEVIKEKILKEDERVG